MSINVSHTQLQPFGVEVRVNLARLNDADKEELRALYARDGLLIVRDIHLSFDEQLDFCAIFGPALRGPGETYVVSNVEVEGVFGDAELLFHNDVPYIPSPYLAGALHATDIQGSVSPTRFASGMRAYERLPQALRARVDTLTTIQIKNRVRDRRNRLTDSLPGDNCAVQSLVGRQRGTDRPYLLAGQWHTAGVTGMSDAESDAFLEELFTYFYAADNIYDHQWKTGDLVLWDNLALAHARHPAGSGRRTLQRTSLADYTYKEQYPTDQVTTYDLQQYRKLPSLPTKKAS